MRVRVPEILTHTIDTQPGATPWTCDALRILHDEVASNAPIRALQLPAPDFDEWRPCVAERVRRNERWLDTDWFFAETYLYRRVVEAVRFFETDVDPFRAIKDEELARSATWEHVEQARESMQHAGTRRDEVLQSLLAASLWGNRLDLSYGAAASHGTHAAHDDLLVDDRARAMAALSRPGARIDLVADNAGTELLVDLVLVESLLAMGAARVVVHVKAHPTFVSDATAADVRDALVRLGGELPLHLASGRLRVAPDTYWNSPNFVDRAPPRIAGALAALDLAIVKGDANYRRLIGDAEWDPTTEPSRASGPLPCPMLALRTLKSDPLVGLPSGLAESLDAGEHRETWRVDGKRGVAELFDVTSPGR